MQSVMFRSRKILISKRLNSSFLVSDSVLKKLSGLTVLARAPPSLVCFSTASPLLASTPSAIQLHFRLLVVRILRQKELCCKMILFRQSMSTRYPRHGLQASGDILADESAKRSGGNKKWCSIFVQELFKPLGRIKDEYSCVQSWQTGARSGRQASLG